MNILVPQGIGDSVWALFKIQGLAEGGPIRLFVAAWHDDAVERRAVDFLSRFSFVDDVALYPVPRLPDAGGPLLVPGPETTPDGRYRYWPDGQPHDGAFSGIDRLLVPNAPLERGIRLEQWLPEVATNWKIFDDYRLDAAEERVADRFAARHGPYAAFFMGSLDANAVNSMAGHNRGALWKPQDWVYLGREVNARFGLRVLVVGAPWDLSYWEREIEPRIEGDGFWVTRFDEPIGTTFALCRRARFVVSYQSGIGIVSHYFGVPTAIFWRPEGNSINATHYLSFDERMASAWARPDYLERGLLLPAIYGRHGVEEVLAWAERWAMT